MRGLQDLSVWYGAGGLVLYDNFCYGMFHVEQACVVYVQRMLRTAYRPEYPETKPKSFANRINQRIFFPDSMRFSEDFYGNCVRFASGGTPRLRNTNFQRKKSSG